MVLNCAAYWLSLTCVRCPLQFMQPSFLSVGMMLAKEPETILVLVTFPARCSKPFGTFTHWVSAPIFIYISFAFSVSHLPVFFDRLPVFTASIRPRFHLLFARVSAPFNFEPFNNLGTSIRSLRFFNTFRIAS